MERADRNAHGVAEFLRDHPKVNAPDSVAARVFAAQSFKLAVSLGGTESLASLPASMTRSGVPAAIRERMGILASTIRLSIGIEHPDDLVADLSQALTAA